MELLFVAYEKKKKFGALFFFLADMSKKVLEFKQHLIFYVNTFMTSLETPSADKNHYKKKVHSPKTHWVHLQHRLYTLMVTFAVF